MAQASPVTPEAPAMRAARVDVETETGRLGDMLVRAPFATCGSDIPFSQA